MDLARERLRRFNEQAQPAFHQWLHSTFGKEITELRELAQKLQELQRLVFEIEDYKSLVRCSYHQAYQAVMERRNHPESFTQKTERDEDSFEDDDCRDPGFEAEFRAGFESLFGPRHRWAGPKAEYDAMYEEFKESFGATSRDGVFTDDDEAERDFRQNLGNFDGFDSRSEHESLKQESRLKTLYRTLAWKLHPDVNLELDQKRKDLWQQVQDAYEAKDVERLEVLSAMNEIFDDNAKSIESVWSLKCLYDELRSGLKHLQRQINRCSKEIAWGFEKARKKPEKLKRLRKKIEMQMMDDRAELLYCIEYGEKQIQRWKNPPPSRKPRPKAKSSNAYKRSPMTKADMDAYTGFGKKGL
jgi:hypothetical protein